MTTHNTEHWANEIDLSEVPAEDREYLQGIVNIATHWGDAMEERLKAGDALDAYAEQCMRAASQKIGGATGYMVDLAAQLIAKHWVNGDGFRSWWNAYHNPDNGPSITDAGSIIVSSVMEIKTNEPRPDR